MAARMDDARIMQFLLSGMNTGCAQSARMNDFACDAVNRDARLMAHAPVRRHGGLAANQDVRNSRLVRTSARDDLSQVMGSTPSVHPTIGHHLSLNEGAAAARVAAADEAPAAAPAAAAAAAAASVRAAMRASRRRRRQRRPDSTTSHTRDARPIPGYSGHWRGKQCGETLASLKHTPDEGGARTAQTLAAHRDLSLHLGAGIHARQVADAPATRLNSTSRAMAVPREKLVWLARGQGARPHLYEHSKGDIPGYGSFTNYIDSAARLGLDIRHRDPKK